MSEDNVGEVQRLRMLIAEKDLEIQVSLTRPPIDLDRWGLAQIMRFERWQLRSGLLDLSPVNGHAQGANASRDEDRQRSENMLNDLRMQVAQLRSSVHRAASDARDLGQVETQGRQ